VTGNRFLSGFRLREILVDLVEAGAIRRRASSSSGSKCSGATRPSPRKIASRAYRWAIDGLYGRTLRRAS
jgi:hypothetical protein